MENVLLEIKWGGGGDGWMENVLLEIKGGEGGEGGGWMDGECTIGNGGGGMDGWRMCYWKWGGGGGGGMDGWRMCYWKWGVGGGGGRGWIDRENTIVNGVVVKGEDGQTENVLLEMCVWGGGGGR